MLVLIVIMDPPSEVRLMLQVIQSGISEQGRLQNIKFLWNNPGG